MTLLATAAGNSEGRCAGRAIEIAQDWVAA